MKKIIREQILEEYKYYCDVHPERECFSKIESVSWYGSTFDMMVIEVHLCDECLAEFYTHMEQKYKKTPEEMPLL
jgi:hypothetical protein